MARANGLLAPKLQLHLRCGLLRHLLVEQPANQVLLAHPNTALGAQQELEVLELLVESPSDSDPEADLLFLEQPPGLKGVSIFALAPARGHPLDARFPSFLGHPDPTITQPRIQANTHACFHASTFPRNHGSTGPREPVGLLGLALRPTPRPLPR